MSTPEDPQARLSATQSDETPSPGVQTPGAARWALYAYAGRPGVRAGMPGTSQEQPESADEQLARLRRLAAERGAEVVAEVVDADPGRPGRDRLVRDAFDGGFDRVAVTTAEAVAGTVGEAGLLLDGLDKAGVRLVVADSPSGGDAELRLLSMLSLMESPPQEPPASGRHPGA